MNLDKSYRPTRYFRAAAFAFSALMSGICSSDADAAQVQSTLAANKVGITAQQLLNITLSTNIALPTGSAKPDVMGNVVAGMNIGTNTDLFAVGTRTGFGNIYVNATEFWVRYTLDSSSHRTNVLRDISSPDWGPMPPVTRPMQGALWLSYNVANGRMGMYTEHVTGAVVNYSGYDTFTVTPGQSAVSALYSNWNGHPESPLNGENASLFGAAGICLECTYSIGLNLAFLELRWEGTRYGLYTSAQGYDQIFRKNEACWDLCGWKETMALNIAPVPVPSTVWLFGSAIAGIAITRRAAKK